MNDQRAAWVPYFDNGASAIEDGAPFLANMLLVNAIIFLAPIGHFDQFLEEDPSVNCLVSFLVFEYSCASAKELTC